MKIVENIELDKNIVKSVKKFVDDPMTEADPYIMGRIIAKSIILAMKDAKNLLGRNDQAKFVQGITDFLKSVR